METIWKLMNHVVYKKLPLKVQRSLRKFFPKLVKSQMVRKDWFEKLHTKLHIHGKDYILRMSPLCAVAFTDHYAAGNLSASLRLASDTSMYPPAALQGPNLANMNMPRSGAVIALHENQSNSLISTFLTSMDDIKINLKSSSMPPITFTPLFTGEPSEIRFRDGRFYLRIQSRLSYTLDNEEISCDGSIPISGQIRALPGQLEFNWKPDGASRLLCTQEWLPEMIDEI